MDTNCTFSTPATENSNGEPIGGLKIAISRSVYIPAFNLSPNRYMMEFDISHHFLLLLFKLHKSSL